MANRRISFMASLVLAAILTFGGMNGADARAGKGTSSGSRGTRTYSAPPPTATAPSPVQPMQRTITEPEPAAPRMAPPQPQPQPAMLPRPSFGGSLLSGLAAGFLGAGLFGMLSGGGFFSGLGSFAGILGFLVQIAIVVLLARWLVGFLRNQGPAMAMAGSSRGAAAPRTQPPAPGGGTAGAPPPVAIGPSDYQAFEQTLKAIQAAYGSEDLEALRHYATPEMVSYFGQDLNDNAAKGLVNRLGEPTLLQGDLAEAWRERDDDYATVAMRFSLTDAMVERTTGRVVSGSLDQPQEATEIWTFRRKPGSRWMLSAIQQTR